jgi:hypothetical protein
VEPDHDRDVQAPVRRLNWTTIALIGGLLLLVLVIAYFATRGNSDQDKLTNANVTASTAASHEKACASKQTYDLIKRELFKRAAQLRGGEQAAYDQLSGYSVARMENPVMEREDRTTGAVHCTGSLSLDLPPGVAVVGGRRTLVAGLDYTVQQAADGSGPVVLLSNADAIIAPLATLVRVGQPAPAPTPPAGTNEVETPAIVAPAPAVPPPAASPVPTPSRPVGGQPSFNCANSRTRSEIAVCGDSGLATLDRNTAAQYGRAVAGGSAEQRDLLRETHGRFLRYRDRCPDRQCMAAAYAGRMREIRDIVEGRWQPPR